MALTITHPLSWIERHRNLMIAVIVAICVGVVTYVAVESRDGATSGTSSSTTANAPLIDGWAAAITPQVASPTTAVPAPELANPVTATVPGTFGPGETVQGFELGSTFPAAAVTELQARGGFASDFDWLVANGFGPATSSAATLLPRGGFASDFDWLVANGLGPATSSVAADYSRIADWAQASGVTGLSPASASSVVVSDRDAIADYAEANGLTGGSPTSLVPAEHGELTMRPFSGHLPN